MRHMRGDIAAATDLEALREAEEEMRVALQDGESAAVQQAVDTLHARTQRLAGHRAWASLRENLEVAVVAITVAMAFRAYFLQPFKIPTGSMQPTLYGITSVAQDGPTLFDRIPLKFVKWFVTGDWYREVRARTSGRLADTPRTRSQTPSYVVIGGVPHEVPRDAELRYRNGDPVPAGALLWSGVITAGDHVFVDRIRWNVWRPKRGQVIVFSTADIRTLPPGTHYIKRLAALPGETVSIAPPDLVIDGSIVREPRAIRNIAEKQDGYQGYAVIGDAPYGYLRTPSHRLALGPGEYFALGDNSHNSRDSRYWGGVPRENLVGPACFVYWPFLSSHPARRASRWGIIN
ncbi:MAG: signal peptidase I [Lentisphaerae bacterium]|nr:signal peptidase I [Lentisphaerota bacterium]